MDQQELLRIFSRSRDWIQGGKNNECSGEKASDIVVPKPKIPIATDASKMYKKGKGKKNANTK